MDPVQPQPSKLDAFKPYLEEGLQAGVWNARGVAARAAGAKLHRRLHYSDRLATVSAKLGADGGGAALSPSRRALRNPFDVANYGPNRSGNPERCP